MRLTDVSIRAFKPPQTGQVTHWDRPIGVRVSQGGSKTFIVMVGSGRRQTIGRYPDISLSQARTEAKRILAERTLGRFQPHTVTWATALAAFLEEAAQKNKPRTVRDYTRLLKRHFPFGTQRLTEVTPHDINRRLDRLQKTVSEQNHALVAIKVFFRWAQRRHYVAHSPCEGMQTIKRPARNRVLTDAELAAVYRAAETFGYPFGTIVQLSILTGQRRSEIAWLRRSYFADERCTLPRALTKNKRDHTFPVGKMAQVVIDGIPDESDFLFPAQRGDTVFGGWSKQKTAFDKTCPIEPWTLHDLRRTFAHQWQRLGIKIEHTEAALNHISGTRGGIVGVYQTYNYAAELKDCYALWERRLQGILAPVRRVAA